MSGCFIRWCFVVVGIKNTELGPFWLKELSMLNYWLKDKTEKYVIIFWKNIGIIISLFFGKLFLIIFIIFEKTWSIILLINIFLFLKDMNYYFDEYIFIF